MKRLSGKILCLVLFISLIFTGIYIANAETVETTIKSDFSIYKDGDIFTKDGTAITDINENDDLLNAFTMFSHSVGGNISIADADNKNRLKIGDGYSQMKTSDEYIKDPYIFSYDIKPDNKNGREFKGFFLRGIEPSHVSYINPQQNNNSMVIDYFEWDWYNGKTGNASMGGSGILVQDYGKSVRVSIKCYKEDGLTIGSENITFNLSSTVPKWRNYKFEDNGTSVKMYADNILFTEIKMSEPGVTYDSDNNQFDDEYFGNIKVCNSNGDVLLNVNRTRVNSLGSQLAFAERGMGSQYEIYLDNIELTVTKNIEITEKPVITDKPVITSKPENLNGSDPSSWFAVDDLGRLLPSYEEVGPKRENKTVGMFYWIWHDFFSVWPARNITEILEKNPEAKNDFGHDAWGHSDSGVPYFWNQPLYGYYSSTDKYVLRKHAELIADAGVDVVIFDCTNGTNTFKKGYDALFDVFSKAKEQGINVPKIAFMLNIDPRYMNKNNKVQLKDLYKDIYSKNKYQDLWFYWEGKPLILSNTEFLDMNTELDKEMFEFFSFRTSDHSFWREDTNYEDKLWGWLSVYPQTKYGIKKDGKVEMMTVGIAQNASEHGLVAMNDYRGGVYGRSYAKDNYSYSYNYRNKEIIVDGSIKDSELYGRNFQQQWDYALSVDPDFIFVTGWNEWIAGRHETWQDTENGFPDEFNDEYSRDIEISAGKLKDNYYYQLVANIRRYKGMDKPVTADKETTIDIYKGIEQWKDVKSVYTHYTGNTIERKSKGYGGTIYRQESTLNNDIVSTKVAYDKDNIYFIVECADNISPYTDKSWMRLLLDTCAATDTSKDWEEFEYIINRINPTGSVAYLEKSLGGWNWESAGEVKYNIAGRYMQLEISRSLLGLNDKEFSFNFKWSDNMQSDGDILDFYINGDVAPGGRFMFSFSNYEKADEKDNNNENKLPIALITVCLVAAAVIGVGIFLFCAKKK